VKQALHLATIMLVTSATLAQSTANTRETPTPIIRSTSTLVMVPALVISDSGDLVTDLRESDFRLTDNGVEQKISVEKTGLQSLAVVVLMQTGGGASHHFQDYRKLAAMIDSIMDAPNQRVALVTFDSRPEQIWNFPARVDGMTDAFTHPQGGDQGAALGDAMNCGIDLLEQQPAGARRIIILLSQPKDDGSDASAEKLVRRLGESNITVYSVTFSPKKTRRVGEGATPLRDNMHFRMFSDHDLLAGASGLSAPLGMALEAVRQDTAAAIAALSWGVTVRFADSRDLECELSILASDIPGGYMLSFRPSLNEPGLHIIKVQIKEKNNLNLAARASYWSQGTATEK
jgi:VWFA-related protein